jgi:hypothetical protein
MLMIFSDVSADLMTVQFDCLRHRTGRNILIGWSNLRAWRRRFQAGVMTEKSIQFFCI